MKFGTFISNLNLYSNIQLMIELLWYLKLRGFKLLVYWTILKVFDIIINPSLLNCNIPIQLFLKKPNECQQLVQTVLSLATQEWLQIARGITQSDCVHTSILIKQI